MIEAGGQVIQVDPAQGSFEGPPAADLVLITDRQSGSASQNEVGVRLQERLWGHGLSVSMSKAFFSDNRILNRCIRRTKCASRLDLVLRSFRHVNFLLASELTF